MSRSWPASTRGRILVATLVAAAAGLVTTWVTSSLPLGAVVAALVALGVSSFAARTVARPLTAMTELIERDPGADLRDVRGPIEVERLAAALHRASDAVRDERQTIANDREHLAKLIDELADAIFIADEAGRIVRVNAPARAYAGGDALGRRLVEVIREHEALEAIAAARDGREHIATIERGDPRRFVRVVVRPLAAEQMLVVVQDLTTLRRLETMRSDFVANVSHELRRPITALKAMAETLEEGALEDPSAARDFVSRMHREIDGLAQLVNELLALTRMESGEEPLALERRASADLLAESARRMGPLAVRAGVSLYVSRARASDVRADAARVDQVLTNLVHNAVKFTPEGGTVRMAAEDEGDWVAFTVSDNGAGIEAADLDRIFERFYKADRARSTEGTGLGLAIAKHIVQAHGGRIEASSAGAGRGSIFRFTLPRASD